MACVAFEAEEIHMPDPAASPAELSVWLPVAKGFSGRTLVVEVRIISTCGVAVVGRIEAVLEV